MLIKFAADNLEIGEPFCVFLAFLDAILFWCDESPAGCDSLVLQQKHSRYY